MEQMTLSKSIPRWLTPPSVRHRGRGCEEDGVSFLAWLCAVCVCVLSMGTPTCLSACLCASGTREMEASVQ